MNTLIIGSRIAKEEQSINFYKFDDGDGSLTFASGFGGIELPTFQCFDNEKKILYSVSEYETAGFVNSYKVDPALQCTLLESVPSEGGSPCHVALSPSGEYLTVANYMTGTFNVLDTTNHLYSVYCQTYEGKGPNPDRQERAHIHSALFNSTTLFVADLGRDKVLRFDNEFNQLASIDTPPGCGPRHMTFSLDGTTLFVLCELSNEVLVYCLNQKNPVLLQRISTIPSSFTEQTTAADIHVSNDGKFLYCSNRGHDSIAIFEWDNASSTLMLLGYSKTEKEPRNFTLSPSGSWLLVGNGSSDSVTIYPIDKKTGLVGRVIHKIEIPQPVCLTFI